MLLRSALAACFAPLLVVFPAVAQSPVLFPSGPSTPLGQQIATITTGPAVVRAHWGIAVTAMDGAPIYGMNEGEFFRPASNAKLFTTAAAMHLLGPDFLTEDTISSLNAVDKDGVLHGSLTFYGEGDANLSGRHFPYENAARHRERLKSDPQGDLPPLYKIESAARAIAHEVKVIDGNIIGDDARFPWEPYPNDWSIDDAVWGYGAPVSALTINDNQLELIITPGARAGDKATVSIKPADVPYYQIDAKVTTVASGERADVRIDRDPGSKSIRVVGTVVAGKTYSQDIAIHDPAEYAAMALKLYLEASGVKVNGKAIAHHALSDDTLGFGEESHEPLPSLPSAASHRQGTVHEHKRGELALGIPAQPFSQDVIATLKVSQNLHAEMLLRQLGVYYGKAGTTVQGARVVRQFLVNAGLDPDDFMFYDGSGLSGHDLVTPRATAKLLSFATQQPWFAQWKAGLPVGGEDGTLAGRFPKAPLKDHLFAKTGTLSEARALSGYVDCASGKTVIFSVMVDNHAPNTPADREAMDAIVAAIAANN